MSDIKTQIVICLGSSCFSRGNRDTLEVIKDYLKVNDLGDQVIFKGQLCSQTCNRGPVIWIDGKKHEAVSPTSIIPILDQIFSFSTEASSRS